MTTIAAHAMSPVKGIRDGLILAGRSIVKIRKNPATLADVTIGPVIFLVMFVFLFGGAVGGNWHAYLQTLLPGLMVQNIVFASMGTGTALITDADKGVFDRFRSLPIARSAPLVGAVLGDTVRYVVSLAVLLGIGSALGFRVHTDALAAVLAVLMVVAAGLCLCWVGVFIAMLVRNVQAAQGVMVALMMPLTFASNVFVPSGTMPGWLQAWTRISPVSQLSDVTRGLLLGGPVAGPLLYGLAWLAGIVVVFFPLAMRVYRRRAS
ncbi:MAG TPA: ABC transporter permease [Pseudonocardiaceae bacterium]|jgi:oleandomycin transport system permease protein